MTGRVASRRNTTVQRGAQRARTREREGEGAFRDINPLRYVSGHAEGPVGTDTLGTRTTNSLNRIADIVAEEMRLSTEVLAALGWEPTTESDRTVRKATRELTEEL